MLATIKNTLYVLSGYALRALLFVGITATIFVIVFGSSATLKTSLQSTNIYSRLVPSLINDSIKNDPQAASNSISNPDVQQILINSFTAADLQRKTETIIDKTYAWLNNKAASLAFTVDFTPNKKAYAEALATYAFVRYEKLPLCAVDPAELDPLTATCKANTPIAAETKASYQQQIFEDDAFLPQTVFTEADLPKNASGQTITERFNYAPTLFTWLKRAPYIVAALFLLLALEIVLLNSRKRKGVRALAGILIGSGVSIIVFPLLFMYVLPIFTKSVDFTLEAAGTQQLFGDLLDELNRIIDLMFVAMGAAVAGVGVILYLTERITRPSSKYHNLDKMTGLASSYKRSGTAKQSRGKVSAQNVPIQSSDDTITKTVKKNSKYRKLYKKKEIF